MVTSSSGIPAIRLSSAGILRRGPGREFMVSGFYAVFARRGEPDPEEARRLGLAMRHRGRSRVATWSDRHVSLGHVHTPTTEEALRERLPLESSSGSVLVWDGRIDNRAELGAALGWDLQTVKRATDADLVLASYDRWGIQLLERTVGDFSMVIWDPRSGEMFCATDPIGWRPLHYIERADAIVVASEAQQLVEAGAAPGILDETYVLKHLAGHALDASETGFVGVRAVPFASAARITRSGVQVDRWWTPRAERRPSSYEECVEEVTPLIDEAIRARRRTPSGPVAFYLSGGVDSSALAGPVAMGGPTVAITGFSSRHETLDERVHARKVVSELGLDWIQHDIGDCNSLSTAWLPDSAFDQALVPAQASLKKSLNLAAASTGARVVIDGNGGDEFFNGDPRHLADAILRGHPVHAVRVAHRRAGLRGAPRLLAGQTFRAITPGRLQPIPREERPFRPPQDHVVGNVPGRPEADVGRFTLWSRRRRIATDVDSRLSLAAPYQRWYNRHTVQPLHIELRSPLLDRRVIEFALSLPDWIKRHGGTPRKLLRSYGAAHVGREPMLRPDKTYFNPLMLDALVDERERVEQGLAAIEPIAGIDLAALDRYVALVREEGSLAAAVPVWRATTAGLLLSRRFPLLG